MLDAHLRPLIAPAVDRTAAALAKLGVGANALSWCGFGLGMVAVALLAHEHYWPALAAFLANRLCDGLDGAVARHRGPTDLGGFLDIVLDFIVYAGVVLGFALARPGENALAAAFLLFSFMATASTFLAFAAIAARRGLHTERLGPKAIYYLGGLTEGTETIVAVVLFCAWPDQFVVVATVFGVLCCLTAAARLYQGYVSFAPDG